MRPRTQRLERAGTSCMASAGRVEARPIEAKTCKSNCSKVFCKKLNGIRIDSSDAAPSVIAVDFFGSGYRRLPTLSTAADSTSPAKLKLLALKDNLRAGVSTIDKGSEKLAKAV